MAKDMDRQIAVMNVLSDHLAAMSEPPIHLPASADASEVLISQSLGDKLKEQALAREFVRLGLHSELFLEQAQFEETKAILQGAMV